MAASDRMWAECKEERRIEMSEFVNKAVTSGEINIKTANVKWLQIESLDASRIWKRTKIVKRFSETTLNSL